MSLQVWLPLNGDLKNQGLNNCQFLFANSSNTLINDNGKIGKCYKNQGTTSDGIYSEKKINLSNTFSMFCWFKFDSIGNNNINALITQCATANKEGFILLVYKASSDSGYLAIENGASTNIYKGTTLLQAGNWYHGGFTYNGSQLKLYLNGQLEGEWSNINGTVLNTYIGLFVWAIREDRNPPIGSSFHFAGYLNDVRLYDHCLSMKEIEEISKGLVLHYKLDNVINNIVYDCSGYNYNSKIIGTYSLNTTSARYSKNLFMDNTNTANHIETLQDILYDKTYLTTSCWIKADKSKSQVIFVQPNIEFGFLNNLAYVNTVSSTPFSLINYKNNEWNHIVVIKNNTNYELYINGKKETRGGANNYYLHNGNKLYLLNRNYNNNYAGNANISDFRIYATILTEEQILKLYNISATIDKDGNIYSRELVEE